MSALNQTMNYCLKVLKFMHLDEVKTELSNHPNKDELYQIYSKWFVGEFLETLKFEIEKYHAALDIVNKSENLQVLIAHADSSMKKAWRFFNDSNKSINTLIIEDKKQAYQNLVEIDKSYDPIIKDLEDQLHSLSEEFKKELNNNS